MNVKNMVVKEYVNTEDRSLFVKNMAADRYVNMKDRGVFVENVVGMEYANMENGNIIANCVNHKIQEFFVMCFTLQKSYCRSHHYFLQYNANTACKRSHNFSDNFDDSETKLFFVIPICFI